jgi:hypothetical protein
MSTRRLWKRTGTAVVALGLLHGSAGAADLSKPAFVTAADKICGASNKKVEAAALKAFASLGPDDQPSPAHLKAFAVKAVPLLLAQVKDLRKLSPPKADKAAIKKLFDGVEAAANKVGKDPQLILDENLFSRLDK